MLEKVLLDETKIISTVVLEEKNCGAILFLEVSLEKNYSQYSNLIAVAFVKIISTLLGQSKIISLR